MLPWLYFGLASQREGRHAEARNAFRRGLAVAEADVIQIPRNGYYHSMLAYFCAQTGQAGRARVEAAQALQIAEPLHNDILWTTTLAYERIGDRAAALQTLEAAPRALLDDLRRWPEASALTADGLFSRLTPAPPAR